LTSLSTPIAFGALWFWNGAIYQKSKPSTCSIDDQASCANDGPITSLNLI